MSDLKNLKMLRIYLESIQSLVYNDMDIKLFVYLHNRVSDIKHLIVVKTESEVKDDEIIDTKNLYMEIGRVLDVLNIIIGRIEDNIVDLDALGELVQIKLNELKKIKILKRS